MGPSAGKGGKELTKREFIGEVSTRAGLTKRDSERAMDAIFQTLAHVLTQGGRLCVQEFGVFDTRLRAPRRARNPQTGDAVYVEAARVPVLRTNKALLRRLNGPAAAGEEATGTTE